MYGGRVASVSQDYAAALARHREAADGGDRGAAFALGLMYNLGLGVGQDYAESVRWYRRAAERGLPRAQCNLGFLYGTGRGVPQDWVMAYAWYNLAAAGGEDLARRNRDLVAGRMTPAQLEVAQQRSTELFERVEQIAGSE